MPDKLPKTPSFSLDGRRALVSGAGRGIGRAAAAALSEYGATVTLIARNKTEITAVADAIIHAGGNAEAIELDVTDLAAVRTLFSECSAFHIVVNNAGTNRPKPMLDVSEADYDAVFELNVKSAFFVAQAAARRMVDDEIEGSLIHMGSQMGHVGGRNRSLYCASKWAIEGMNKALAIDLAPFGIRSNTISPTFIETPLTRPFFEDDSFKKDVLTRIKLGRIGQVEDLMGAIVYLASDASSLVTGTSIIVDGGWTAD
jgi:NAD(P)-dependent dehydrogenase (short-subunit alcohol dehydrogenase family)